jgi:hypothetical protein
MQKSVYSLVLSDEVVTALDRLAYRSGTSRSALADRILAEYVSCQTPEMRMREIFEQAERLLTAADGFQPLLQPSDSMMSLRSALSYKYNPTVRYSVELFRDGGGSRGELRATVRSQSSALILCMGQFFRLWDKLERAYIGGADSDVQDGKYVRALRLPETSQQRQGEIIADYIRALDGAMKAFFARLDEPEEAARACERIYKDYLKNDPSI